MFDRKGGEERSEIVRRRIEEAAARALAEAEARREQAATPVAETPEINGRGGTEPVRYGDWEVKGLASDF
jgi:hypothetical protein